MEFISSTDTLPSARTSIGTAAMEFISSTSTCQVPVPVLALPRWNSFPVRALAKCPYQYWHCRDGDHFQYGHLPSARTSIGNAAMEFISSTGTWQVHSLPKLVNSIVLWKNCDKKQNTNEFEYGGYHYIQVCAAP